MCNIFAGLTIFGGLLLLLLILVEAAPPTASGVPMLGTENEQWPFVSYIILTDNKLCN